MKQELIATGKTVEAAILNGAKELGVDRSLVNFEVIELPKKGFLGFGEVPAKVRVSYEAGIENVALEFVSNALKDMCFNAEAVVSETPGNGILIKISGEDSALLIGHHGETLDALQYLVNLAVNKKEEDEEDEESSSDRKDRYSRVVVDVENYRAKREETLKELAKRMAQKVLKYKKPMSLEPMNPHERKIIHSEIQKIDGVTTSSVGYDSNRRIVIYPEGVPVRSGSQKKDQERSGSDEHSDKKRRHRRGRGKGRQEASVSAESAGSRQAENTAEENSAAE